MRVADTVLALVAHPDDESFWMGGAISQFVRAGERVRVQVASDGLWGRSIRRDEQFAAACECLGATGQIDTVFPDQKSDTVAQVWINDWAATMVQKYQPSLVLTHYHGDLNHDHRAVSIAALVATRDVCPVWMFEPEYPERVVGPYFDPWQGGDLITVDARVKWSACQCYPEELAAKPKTRSRGRLMVERFVEVR